MFSLPHQQKIQRLETKRDIINDADLTGTQLKRWVINLSKYKLSGNQNKILVKGLNYAVTPEKIPTEEFVVAAEQATWSLPQEQKDKLRADITGVLKSAKVPKQNITITGENSFKRATEREVHHHTPCGQRKGHRHHGNERIPRKNERNVK